MEKRRDFFKKLWQALTEHAIISADHPRRKGGTPVAPGAKWKVIHMARSEKHANEILELFAQEGILARSKQVYRTVSSEDNYYEIDYEGNRIH